MGLLSLFGLPSAWYMQNTEKPTEMIVGQFPAEGVTEKLENKYSVHSALNRQNPIIQFISGSADEVSFKAKFRPQHSFDKKPQQNLSKLKEWMKMDKAKKRPPVVSFWIGDKHLNISQCFVKNLSNEYERPTGIGQLREVNVTVELIRYKPFTMSVTKALETRYHRAHIRDYYEMLCFREYGDPLLGDVIRKRHPNQPYLYLAATVKLPSIEAIRKESVEPKSVVLNSAFGNRATPQRMAVLEMLDKRNKTYVSHLL